MDCIWVNGAYTSALPTGAHEELFKWHHRNGRNLQLIRIRSKYLEPFLQNLDAQVATLAARELLVGYYEHVGKFIDAAKALFDIARNERCVSECMCLCLHIRVECMYALCACVRVGTWKWCQSLWSCFRCFACVAAVVAVPVNELPERWCDLWGVDCASIWVTDFDVRDIVQ